MKLFQQITWAIFLAGLLVATGPVGFAADVPPAPSSAFPLTITDGAHRVVRLAAPPHRIISLSPAATDILVNIGAHAELVGVTRYCTVPAADESHVKRLGGVLDPDYEGLVALKPDLVVMPLLADKSMQDKLTALGLSFVILHPEGLAGVLADIRMVARATGHEETGETTANYIEAIRALVMSRWKDVPEEKRPRVLILMDGASPAPGSYVDDLLTAAGGRNVVPKGTKAWVTVSTESILQLNPDLIINIFQSLATTPMSSPPQNTFGKFTLKTVLNGQEFFRPGPDLGAGLWELARTIYPDKFPETTISRPVSTPAAK